jgi:hypothetical protein
MVKLIQIFLVFWLILVAYQVGRMSNQDTYSDSERISTEDRKSLSCEELVKSLSAKIYISPSNANKRLIVDGELDAVYLQRSPVDLQFIDNIISARNVLWNGDSTKVAIASHISSDEDIYIIDVETGGYFITEGKEQFIESQDRPELYSHGYAGLVEWNKDNNLKIRVSGYPDGTDSFRPSPRHYLINSETGKVIKEL